MAILAHAPWPRLKALWAGETRPAFSLLRKPETGLVMLRGRIGGSGPPFNVGEATLTRCSVKLESGPIGHGYVMGRQHEHALAAALCDAMLQDDAHRASLMAGVVRPLRAERAEALRRKAAKTAATKVDFFTLVRGDD